MRKPQPADLLPEVTHNKRYAKKQKFMEKKKLKELRRENPQAAAKLEKAALKKRTAAMKASEGAKKSPSAIAKTATQSKRAKTKERRPTTVVANAPTGRETFTKKKARELVKTMKGKAKQQAKLMRHGDADNQRRRARRGEGRTQADPEDGAHPLRPRARAGDDLDNLLIARTIRGHGVIDDADGDGTAAVNAGLSGGVRRDPSLYPSDIAFYQDYAEKKQSESVSEDALLKHANDFFKKVGNRERQLNTAAAAYLRKMKEVNRKGGDKDGFRYVVPKNVKSVVKMMKENEYRQANLSRGETDGNGGGEGEWIDGDTLQSTFGGDGVGETSDKPMRRRKKCGSTFDDFYQFQVSRRWTRNAESFLNRGRAHKSLFEAKKRQRSIRKL